MSDTYDLKDIDDVVYEVDCAMVNKGADVIDTGANASAEGEDQDDTLDEGPKKVNNVIDGFRLNYYGDEQARQRAFGSAKEYQKVLGRTSEPGSLYWPFYND